MNISGTLHLYSGADGELFFVFDDEFAQVLYRSGEFRIELIETRRVFVSLAKHRFVKLGTLSFSKKQTEIKVSLCTSGSKTRHHALLALYDWFVPRQGRPEPLRVLATFKKVRRGTEHRWELRIQEPVDLEVPPGLDRRKKTDSPVRKTWKKRREIELRDTEKISRPAEEIVLGILRADFPEPAWQCLWRDGYFDSEREEIRSLGIIADIDIWNNVRQGPELFIEVKAQKITRRSDAPRFYLSRSEWRSMSRCKEAGLRYQIWLLQYEGGDELFSKHAYSKILVFESIDEAWLDPETFFVRASKSAGRIRRPPRR